MKIELYLSVISISISLFLLIIHIKNRITARKTYKLTSDLFSRNNFNLMFLETHKKNTYFQIKLALINPSPTKLIIISVKAYLCKSDIQNIHKSKFTDWEELDIRWWPSQNDDFTDEKYLHEEYKNLLVKDLCNIFIQIPNNVSQKYYKFEVQSSFGPFIRIEKITGTNLSFPFHYKKYKRNSNTLLKLF